MHLFSYPPLLYTYFLNFNTPSRQGDYGQFVTAHVTITAFLLFDLFVNQGAPILNGLAIFDAISERCFVQYGRCNTQEMLPMSTLSEKGDRLQRNKLLLLSSPGRYKPFNLIALQGLDSSDLEQACVSVSS